MNRSLLKWLVPACMVILLVCGWARGPVKPLSEVQTIIADYSVIAQSMNIRNMVSAIYLGPRLGDTLLEVMVVVLAVYGMKFVRETL